MNKKTEIITELVEALKEYSRAHRASLNVSSDALLEAEDRARVVLAKVKG